jgi:hypothetical protein
MLSIGVSELLLVTRIGTSSGNCAFAMLAEEEYCRNGCNDQQDARFSICFAPAASGGCFHGSFPYGARCITTFGMENAGVWTCLQRAIYEQTRRKAGRSVCPSVVIIDGQSVKTNVNVRRTPLCESAWKGG